MYVLVETNAQMRGASQLLATLGTLARAGFCSPGPALARIRTLPEAPYFPERGLTASADGPKILLLGSTLVRRSNLGCRTPSEGALR